jgi:hypothetical protein
MVNVADKFWQIAVSVAGIGAVGAFVFLAIARKWLDVAGLRIEKITPEHAYRLMRLCLILAFIFAMAALLTYNRTLSVDHPIGGVDPKTPSRPPDKYKGWPALELPQDDVTNELAHLIGPMDKPEDVRRDIEFARQKLGKTIVNNWDCWLMKSPRTDGDGAKSVIVQFESQRYHIRAICYLADGQPVAVFRPPKKGRQSLRLIWGALLDVEPDPEHPHRLVRLKLEDCQFAEGTGGHVIGGR